MIRAYRREALFFLRHYNDIDHIVPVIYKWSQSGHQCTVVLIGFTNIRKDYRIQFISTLACVKVLSIHDLLTPVDQFHFCSISLVLYGYSGQYVNRSFYRLFTYMWPKKKRLQFWNKIAKLLLKTAFVKNIKSVVVFDWISQKSTLPLEFVHCLLLLSRNEGHTSISLPHGDSPHINELIRNHEFSIQPQAKYAFSDMFDFIVCPNELCAKRYRPFISSTKIKVLGSPRYNDEWLARLRRLLPTTAIQKNQQLLNIVFFLRKNEFSLFWDEIKRVMKMLIQFENVQLIIKPHTRDYQQKPLRSILRQIQSPRIEVAQEHAHSVNLIEMAHIVIDVATSAAFEAVKHGTPVLSADYLHAGRSTIAHYIPETTMHCRDDIYHAIQRFIKDPQHDFYNTQHRANFIRHMLDVPDKYVLERYVSLLAGETQAPKRLVA